MNSRSSFLSVGRIRAAALLFTLAAVQVPDGVFAQTRRTCCVPRCSAIFRTGYQPNSLQVHVVGQRYDTIEAYFKHGNDELFYRDQIPGSINLHCGNVFLAPANPYGTFAVRFGQHLDSVRVYGWKHDNDSPEMKEITKLGGYPIRLTWILPQTLKINYGACQEKEYILSFKDSDTPWVERYKSP